MKKLKVLQVITKAEWAGAQRVVYEICKYIREKENLDIEIEVAVGDNGILVERLEELGIKVFILENLKRNINPFVDAKGYLEIKKIVSNNKYDVVHCHSTKAGILGRLAAHRLHVSKVFFTVHGFWPIFQYTGIKRKAAEMVERFMATRTTDMVFISKSDIEIAKNLGIYSSSKSRLIYNSITIPKISKGLLRDELHLEGDVRIIGNVSRVEKVKNPFLFIEVSREYFNKYPDNRTIFIWIGNGPLLDKARLLVREYALEKKVFFLGFRDRGERFLADFDLLFMTSTWEGVPITILEAIALEVPILSSNVGGISEIIGEENIYPLTESNENIVARLNCNNVSVNKSYLQMPENYIKFYRS